MATIFYGRVSTAEQTSEHQVKQAEAAGYVLDRVVIDHGVSGVSVPLRDRPEGRKLFDILRAGDTLVVRWIDRLGRNYADVCDNLRHFLRMGVTVRTIINSMEFDGAEKDPMKQAVRDALIAFMAATAEAQAEATKEAQKAGIAHAKGRDDAYLGRKPSYDRETFEAVIAGLDREENISELARQTGLTRQTIMRVRENRAAAEAALSRWEQ